MSELRLIVRSNELRALLPGGEVITLHPLWLRERCRDAKNMDPKTEQRLFNPSNLATDLSIVAITTPGCGEFIVRFNDGACCAITAVDVQRELPQYSDADLPVKLPWRCDNTPPPSVDWRDCGDGVVQHQALSAFLSCGYIVISNVPARRGCVLEVARRFGIPRETNFGVLFDVCSVPDANDLAYTSLPLDPHTDNPYRTPVPGIQLLHCISNPCAGGLSTLVDGMEAARRLRETAPEDFDMLCQTKVKFRYTDCDCELVAHAPLIELDRDGEFAGIHYSPRLDFVPLLPYEELERFYAARRWLNTLLTSPELERRFRLADGDLIMFDNRRLLHGRTGFEGSTGRRHLQGCYIDADGPRSRYRVLNRGLICST